MRNTAFIEARKQLLPYVGEKVQVVVHGGRGKTIDTLATIEETHPSFFILQFHHDDPAYHRPAEKRVSYSYADLITETIKIQFLDPQE